MIVQASVGDYDAVEGVASPGNCQGNVDYFIKWLTINLETNAA
jgi:hypothetical protein